MLGAVIGDIAGSRFEWHNHKSKSFELFSKQNGSRMTDDSIMTFAVAQAILDCKGDYTLLGRHAVARMQELGREYPNAGYGGSFYGWIFSDDPRPYMSWGNGAAMRVSPCGFAAGSLEEAKNLSKAVTGITHNHHEGLKGAEAVAVAVFLAREGKTKKEIRAYTEENYYAIPFSLAEIRSTYRFDASCQGTVPQALESFFESVSFEDAIRNAISIGGDSDTIAAIAGGVAQAYYGIPRDIRNAALTYLDPFLIEILNAFEVQYGITR